MRSAIVSFTMLTALAVTPAMAQMQQGNPPAIPQGEVPAPPSHQPISRRATNLNPQTTRSEISPSLPSAGVGQNADATQYLRAAQNALRRNRTGEAQQALENAETFLLNRSVPQGAANTPDNSPAVRNISAALQALANHDREGSMDIIGRTIPMTQQSGMQGGGSPTEMGNVYDGQPAR